jgi:D-glycero-D-manno-heptose 1,7-bisphosphate phosphatase
MKQAVFLDRDGTLIEDCGYLSDPSQVLIYDNTIDALKLLKEKFELFIVTNQSGIALGEITMDDAIRVNSYIEKKLADAGIIIKEVYICPHQKEDRCNCQKPKPFFAEKAAAQYSLDLSKSYAIGDHLHDVEFAQCFGGEGVYVLTGHGTHHEAQVPDNVKIANDIYEAAQYIVS